jgi:hypothetical protein
MFMPNSPKPPSGMAHNDCWLNVFFRPCRSAHPTGLRTAKETTAVPKIEVSSCKLRLSLGNRITRTSMPCGPSSRWPWVSVNLHLGARKLNPDTAGQYRSRLLLCSAVSGISGLRKHMGNSLERRNPVARLAVFQRGTPPVEQCGGPATIPVGRAWRHVLGLSHRRSRTRMTPRTETIRRCRQQTSARPRPAIRLRPSPPRGCPRIRT